jgi:t-SNARE complex subunit (syntaxin)
MIVELEHLKGKLETIFPEGQLDIRFARFFEEKIKAITSFFSTMLDIRKEINKSLKEEIDIRKGNRDIEKDIGDDVVRSLAKRIDNFTKKVRHIDSSLEKKIEPNLEGTNDATN